jgi:hypothetical protein
MLKGLYGTPGGALSYQDWIYGVYTKLGYRQLRIARSFMLKEADEGIERIMRHSDDSAATNDNKSMHDKELKLIKDAVEITPFAPLDRLLGGNFVRINKITGIPDDLGGIVLVTMVETIEKMHTDFEYLIPMYNKSNRERTTPHPLNALKPESNSRISKLWRKLAHPYFVSSHTVCCRCPFIGQA